MFWVKNESGFLVDLAKSHYISYIHIEDKFIVIAYFPCFYTFYGDLSKQEEVVLEKFDTEIEAQHCLDLLLFRLQHVKLNLFKDKDK